jgi:hypothetical protein
MRRGKNREPRNDSETYAQEPGQMVNKHWVGAREIHKLIDTRVARGIWFGTSINLGSSNKLNNKVQDKVCKPAKT